MWKRHVVALEEAWVQKSCARRLYSGPQRMSWVSAEGTWALRLWFWIKPESRWWGNGEAQWSWQKGSEPGKKAAEVNKA